MIRYLLRWRCLIFLSELSGSPFPSFPLFSFSHFSFPFPYFNSRYGCWLAITRRIPRTSLHVVPRAKHTIDDVLLLHVLTIAYTHIPISSWKKAGREPRPPTERFANFTAKNLPISEFYTVQKRESEKFWNVRLGWASLGICTCCCCMSTPVPWPLPLYTSSDLLNNLDKWVVVHIRKETRNATRPTLSQFQRLKIRRSSFPSYIKFIDFEALILYKGRSGSIEVAVLTDCPLGLPLPFFPFSLFLSFCGVRR